MFYEKIQQIKISTILARDNSDVAIDAVKILVYV